MKAETRTPLPGTFVRDNLKREIMKEIKLTKGMFALVDDDDYDNLMQWKWSAHKLSKKYWYAERYEGGKTIFMHAQIMNTPKGLVVDHIDHNGINNQKHNLRNCTIKENFLNRKSFSKSGYLGVYKYGDKFLAQKYNGKKVISLGYFNTPEEAAKVYDLKAYELYGEFANLNFK